MPTGISWLNGYGGLPGETLNPVIGCNPVSAGCKHCWAARLAGTRLRRQPTYTGLTSSCDSNDGRSVCYSFNGTIRWRPDQLRTLRGARKPRNWLLCDMGDLFHRKVKDKWIREVLQAVHDSPRQRIFLLTKRPVRMFEVFELLVPEWFPDGLPNVVLGASAEDYLTACECDRILFRLKLAGYTTFLSYEPALECVLLGEFATGLDWVIVGCESGPGARCDALSLNDYDTMVRAAQYSKVPIYVKQLPINGKANHNPEDWPAELRVRQFPRVGV